MCDLQSIILSSRVRLARNLKDIPFRSRMTENQADECIERVLSVLRDEAEVYRYYPMRGMNKAQQQKMVEDHLISPDLLKLDDRGAALVRDDGKVSIMINEEDHIRIQGFEKGLHLENAMKNAFQAEDALERKIPFAFDEQWGYLTACPTNTGTGLRSSVLLHLPMLTILKQMGKVSQLAGKLGLTVRGVYGEESEALGHVYKLSNQVTIGKTESEMTEAVTAVAKQVAEMEMACREKAYEKDEILFLDQLERSMGIMCFARRMTLKEFFAHWSNLKMASAMNQSRIPSDVLDDMLHTMQKAHLSENAPHALSDREIDIRRSEKIRKILSLYLD